ncbi:hypothetical protein [Sodalis-like endosymbiont of Proechinophthirus fluctus]|uniref:hypothetical protein n=1 Tax=Sodalis-like endosymbiont of Proechinophthirus fluctus TaxID=1462730 RepID=UPI00164F6B55|nr:hypothetical protein [Sodalis-like endosymbiont of Proechinophthirus fluctus]
MDLAGGDRANERFAWQVSQHFDPGNDAAVRRKISGYIIQKWVYQHKLSILLILMLAL